ncbi:MAG: c-type cytochrome biogenesis protein CcsB, partial [Desulfobulbaceae bacterium]|nr:c-type cytochrome biogenesis protein CcsB [Desulfobulbaceae bacterium]MDY0350991.1 c-type cytochrome biogenesis protein CcsB [Desulfobulbaceae bacterium]
MNSSQFFGLTTLAYLLSSAMYIALFVFKNRKIGLFGTILCILGTITLTAALGLRWYESYQLGIGHAPL